MTFRTLDDAKDLAGKTALVRVDFNVPMEGGKVTDDTRLRVALPTIQRLRDAGAKVALLAHFDRPKGQRVPSMSLQPVVDDLETLLGAPVRFADDCIGPDAVDHVKPPLGMDLPVGTEYGAGTVVMVDGVKMLAAGALFVDVVGLMAAVWKVVLGPGSAPGLAPVTQAPE